MRGAGLGRLAILLTVAALLGCSKEASDELLRQAQVRISALRAEVVANTREIAPRVTPQHMSECKARLEQANWSGGQYKAAGPLTLHHGYSCFIQGRGGDIYSGPRPGVGYAVQMSKVGGGRSVVGYCGFIFAEGRVVLLGVVHDATVPGLNGCKNL